MPWLNNHNNLTTIIPGSITVITWGHPALERKHLEVSFQEAETAVCKERECNSWRWMQGGPGAAVQKISLPVAECTIYFTNVAATRWILVIKWNGLRVLEFEEEKKKNCSFFHLSKPSHQVHFSFCPWSISPWCANEQCEDCLGHKKGDVGAFLHCYSGLLLLLVLRWG